MKDLSNLSSILEADSAIRAARARAKIAEAKEAGGGEVRWAVDSWKEMSRDIAQDEQRIGK
tara:strand:+ start:1151 stop:1333 length:183 start_codon:yes stop_codon:yes gene_type:complete